MSFAEQPSELRKFCYSFDSGKLRLVLVGRAGFEPATNGLKGLEECQWNQGAFTDSVPQFFENTPLASRAPLRASGFCGTVSSSLPASRSPHVRDS
jgi:hypothetical protein